MTATKRTPRRNWWIFIEKDLEKPGAVHELYGPFTIYEAKWAILHDPIIDASCERNCWDAGLVREDEMTKETWDNFNVHIAISGWSKHWPTDPGLKRVNAPDIVPYVTIPKVK